ncbi:hypothetical protein VOLCADRAFT_89740 [Volvox carteri f. nagariensis]|uniref:Centrosomal protein of 44 kDa n=1 Tax=Volvox carteri f. nagariensis TaxID=3068 RepID=D8TSI5_VOLCA|nr:uncharacterized protein VOLCADRAFT_89740 [Volvox carteri f. nagariensis]EFJ49378.1 hypothetical protein VOLCADRAFT_89740 [Volvox carteri f. nagariensis]|eukprot:XP_002949359.1 hypothetical protein VOLCADRAFT_89740 [Volvox carteri f. nagariensis]
MSTGDLNGNLQRLLRELKAIKCAANVDEVGLRLGDPVALLPLLNFTLLKFSRHVARFIVRHGFEPSFIMKLAGKTDQRFVESCFKLFREVLNVRTVLTPSQFFEQGYAERKVLLLCDIIAVCKKLHNEEVRQERLAALKASRQLPGRSTLNIRLLSWITGPFKQSASHTPQKQPSGQGQSVYKPKRVLTTSRSPSPSASGQPTAAKGASRPQGTPAQASLAGSQGPSLELTFRPAAPANIGHRQGPAGSAAAQPPIRTWFMNPAFAEGDEANVDLGVGTGLGFGATGRPDSSAWWRLSPNPPEQPQQQAASFWRSGVAAADTGRTHAAVDSSICTGLDSERHLSFGRQPAAASTTVAASEGYQRKAALQQQGQLTHQRQPERGALQPTQQQGTNAAALRQDGTAAAVTSAATAGGSGTAGGGHSLPARDLDEWSFSKFFGPAKTVPRRRRVSNGGDGVDSSSQHPGNKSDGELEAVHGADGAATGEDDDLERDGPASDQDRRNARLPAHRARAAGLSPASKQQQQPAGANSAPAGGSGPQTTRADVDWPVQLAKLEREMQQQLQQLQSKLASTEEELEKSRSEARQTRETLQARVTVLEGRVRFLECELELCVKRVPSQELAGRSSPGRDPSSAPLDGLAAEPSLSWNSPGRSPSGGRAADSHPRELTAPSLCTGDASQQHGPGPVIVTAATTATTAASTSTSVYSNRREQGVLVDPGQAYPSVAASATSGFAESEAAHVRDAGSVAPGDLVGLRWDNHTAAPVAAPSASSSIAYPMHASRNGAGRVAISSGPAGGPVTKLAMPQQAQGRDPRAAPAASQPSLPPGAAVAQQRGPSSFLPMPQPSFSFQPSSLMQQVASAAAPPPPPQQQQQPQQGGTVTAAGASCRPQVLGSSLHSSGLDNAPSRWGPAGGPQAASGFANSGLQLAAGNARMIRQGNSSMDAGPGHPPFPGTEAGSGTAAPGHIACGCPDDYLVAWGGTERVGAGAGETVNMRSATAGHVAAQHGSLGGPAPPLRQQDYAALQGPAPAGSASAAPMHHHHHILAVGLAAPPQTYAPPDQPGWISSANVGGSAEAALVAGQSAPSVTGGAGSGGAGDPGLQDAGGAGGGPRKTEDVISSLYLRYTEAQDFLQTLRKR